MLKQIRILGTAKAVQVVDADRDTHVTKDAANGGPDEVEWIIVGGGRFQVHFDSSPFQDPAQPEDINVPPQLGEPKKRTVVAPKQSNFPQYHKYTVKDNLGHKDDPNVIIDS